MAVTARFVVARGRLPAGAHRSGYERDHKLLFVARAKVEGGVHIGKTRADWKAAAIPYGGKEVWTAEFEVWVPPLSNKAGGAWSTTPVNNAVAAGNEADGTPLYPARAWHEGGLHLGKWRADWSAASISYAGAEIWAPKFEVLTASTYIDGDDAFAWENN